MLRQRNAITVLLIAIGILLLTANASAASLTTHVDRTDITINDTLLLTITLDRQGADDIDFSDLEVQFDILQRQQSSQTSIVNGRITSRTQWTLVIAPKDTGDLLIPSLSANGAFSDAITVSVGDNSASNSSSTQGSTQGNPQSGVPNSAQHISNENNPATPTEEVFLRAVVDNDTVYVQEQVILRLQLHYRISLTDYEASEFAINNSAQELIDKKNYKANLNGVTYNVLEHVYALHPQTSGTLAIPQQLWQAEKPSNRFGRIQSPYLRVTSQALTITVKPIPRESTANHWLPASDIDFTQQWQQSTINAKVGEPLSYQLIITAEGLGHSQLPNMSLDASANKDFTIYSDKADTKNQLSPQGIVGTRVINYAVIPKNTGTFTLPPISVRWWNVNTDKEEVITLESQNIVVASTRLDQQNTIPTVVTPTANVINSPPSPYLWWWQLSTLLFATISALLCYLWLKQQRRNNEYVLSSPVNGTRKDRQHNTKKRAINSVYKEIEQAIAQQQWQVVKVLVLEWASTKSQHNVGNSEAFINTFPDLAQAMQMLDKQLYSPAIVVWDFAELLGLLKQQQVPTAESSIDSALESLYR
jgi:hypothetical protein